MLARALLLISLLFTPLFADTPTPPPQAPVEIHVAPVETHPLVGKAQDSSYEHAFVKMILTLGGLLLLVFLTLWVLRKLSHGRVGGFGAQKKIKVLEKRPLSPKTVLYLLELDGKEVFIAESQMEIKTLLSHHEEELEHD